MSEPCLSVERDGPVWVCTLANPPRHTLTAKGVEALTGLVEEIENGERPRVLVLTGGGEGVFIAHYEVGELAQSAERQVATPQAASEGPLRLHPFHQLLLRLEALPVVTIAALNGNTAGGGFELALGCDFRLLADGPYRVGLPETSVGIIPGAGGTQRLARLLGTARTLDLVLHATLLTPPEALELGLVHRLFEPASFREQVDTFADDLAGRAPIAMAAAKEAIQRGSRAPLESGLAIEQECFDRTMRSRDAAGAMRALLESRSYEWRGE
ncbi:MAG: enoyl-CoA hydratase/isomerase family protein [Myxococcota bacterium]